MSKQLFYKELVYLNFDKQEFKFYNVEILSVGYNQIQVITCYGKLGTKGREHMTRFEGREDVFKESRKFAYNKIYEKKNMGYLSLEKTKEAIANMNKDIKKPKKQQSVKKQPEKRRIPFGYDCDKCRKTISLSMYEKINEWARGEGNWDSIPDLHEKIYCLDCQFDLDIFKKKLSPADFS